MDVDKTLIKVFATEVERQYKHINFSARQMNEFLADPRSDFETFWFHLDAIFAAISKISKIFWPSSNKKSVRERCLFLREHWGIPEESSVRLRDVRNSLEHFDERIETWHQNSLSKNFLAGVIAPAGAISGIDPGDYARQYDPGSHQVSIFAVSQNLQSLLTEVDELVSLVAPWALAAPPFTGPEDTSAPKPTTIKDTTILLTDTLFGSSSLENVTFTNCTIEGPAILALTGDCIFVESNFTAPFESLYIPVRKGRLVTGVIKAVNLTFNGCVFNSIGFLVTWQMWKAIKQQHSEGQHHQK